MSKTLILCNCLESQTIDETALSGVGSVTCSKIHTALCTRQADLAAKAVADGNAIIACQQERDRFEEIAAELGAEAPEFVDLRDRAGWSDEGGKAGPKMAALLADALRPPPPTKTFDIVSEGVCLILGSGPVAIDAAERLSEHLSVTLMLNAPDDVPLDRRYDVIAGQLKSATGALGNFAVEIDGLQQVEPGGRGALKLGEPRDGGRSECDVIVDLRGKTPLFPAPEKREGYLRADPGSILAVAEAVTEASHLVGTFEKPLYLSLDPHICAHSRAQQTGCSKCLDVCPTSAIRPSGDHVDIDPMICAGCGSCAALCPSGAISFDDPPVSALFQRMSTMADAYRKAGGNAPRMLVHDRAFGAEMIGLTARFGRGLPADVIPLDLARVSGFGHAEILAALGCGFSAVDILLSPTTEMDALDGEVLLAKALAADPDAIRLLSPTEPDALCDDLYDAPSATPLAEPILPLGTRRQVTRLAVKALRPDADQTPIPLPENAPYGAVLVDAEACTLCLSCASLCPAGALADNPDLPQLRFQEDACLQCGLCANVCPENAITLQPQLNTSDAAFTQQVLREEEPFECIECGAPFGVKSTIEKIAEKLEGKHSMFANNDAARLIRMCDDCRVRAQFHSENNPFAGEERPKPRTTDDYYSNRRDH